MVELDYRKASPATRIATNTDKAEIKDFFGYKNSYN
jgi:hypothetical protein